jgi:hypothetical protein
MDVSDRSGPRSIGTYPMATVRREHVDLIEYRGSISIMMPLRHCDLLLLVHGCGAAAAMPPAAAAARRARLLIAPLALSLSLLARPPGWILHRQQRLRAQRRGRLRGLRPKSELLCAVCCVSPLLVCLLAPAGRRRGRCRQTRAQQEWIAPPKLMTTLRHCCLWLPGSCSGSKPTPLGPALHGRGSRAAPARLRRH